MKPEWYSIRVGSGRYMKDVPFWEIIWFKMKSRLGNQWFRITIRSYWAWWRFQWIFRGPYLQLREFGLRKGWQNIMEERKYRC